MDAFEMFPLKLLSGVLLGIAAVTIGAFPRACFGRAASINGQIERTAADPSGAMIPRATITIHNEGTGFDRSSDTDESGFFRFTVLPLDALGNVLSPPNLARTAALDPRLMQLGFRVSF